MKSVEYGLLDAVVAGVSMRTRYRRRVLSRIVLKKGHAARQHTPADTWSVIPPLLPRATRAAAAVRKLADCFEHVVSVEVLQMPNKSLEPTATVSSVLTMIASLNIIIPVEARLP